MPASAAYIRLSIMRSVIKGHGVGRLEIEHAGADSVMRRRLLVLSASARLAALGFGLIGRLGALRLRRAP